MSDSGRPRDPDIDTRIVQVTRRILDAEGPTAISVSRVAREAEVGRPSVYRRYADADDLMRAVLFAELEGQVDAYPANTPIPPGELLDHFMLMARPSLEFYAENPKRSKALLSVAVFAEDEWQQRWNALSSHVTTMAYRVVNAAVERGEIPDDTNRDVLVMSFMNLMLSVLIGGLTGAYGDVDGWDAMLRAMLRQHLEGLRLRAAL
jgi:AcrR family transcriptional regulator